jgi:hypothetical protein
MIAQAVPNHQHPAPHRRNVGLSSLLLGLTAAPVAWVTQLIVGYGVASHACFPGDMPRASPLFLATGTIVTAFNLAAIIISIAGVVLSFRSWRATREEHAGRSHRLLDVGEGRTRFLAICGMLTSMGFLVATIFASIAILAVPLCYP